VTVLENRFIEHFGGNGEVLPLPGKVHEAKVNSLHLVFAEISQDFAGCAGGLAGGQGLSLDRRRERESANASERWRIFLCYSNFRTAWIGCIIGSQIVAHAVLDYSFDLHHSMVAPANGSSNLSRKVNHEYRVPTLPSGDDTQGPQARFDVFSQVSEMREGVFNSRPRRSPRHTQGWRSRAPQAPRHRQNSSRQAKTQAGPQRSRGSQITDHCKRRILIV